MKRATPNNLNDRMPLERKVPRALYIELVMLGLPTLVLANGLIDEMKKK